MSAPIISGDAETRVQETADDAALSKMSAVRTGYIDDKFIAYFVRKQHRRSPLINRGYFARVATIELILRRFVAVARRTGDGKSQIVSFGAGLDTTFFKLWIEGSAPTHYYEVDFPEVTSRKSAIIRRVRILQECIAGNPVTAADVQSSETPPISPGPAAAADIHANSTASQPAQAEDGDTLGITYKPGPAGGVDVSARVYHLVTADLRDVAAVQAILTSAGIDMKQPTLFLSECVLVYLEPEESCAIIAWASRSFQRSVFVTYEQIRPHDAFGQVMARNLEERGYSLRGLNAFPDPIAQTARYRELGYAGCTVADMNDIYYRLLPKSDIGRIERLEIFDEVEEWHLMSAHYCIAVAVNESASVPQISRAGGRAGGAGSSQPRHLAGRRVAASDAASAAHQSIGGNGMSPARVIVTDMPAPAPKVPKVAHATAASTLTPRELAVQVVHAHEEASAAAHRTVSGRSIRSVSPSPNRAIRERSRSRSLSISRAVSGNESDASMEIVANAVEAASGTTVESMEIAPSPRPDVGSSTTSPSVATPREMRSPVIHTTGGDVVLGTAKVDFEAIAEAEEEMQHARHTREEAGIDIMREAQSNQSGRTSPRATPASFAISEGSKQRQVTSAGVHTTYDAASIEAADRTVTLMDILLPLEQWNSHSSSLTKPHRQPSGGIHAAQS